MILYNNSNRNHIQYNHQITPNMSFCDAMKMSSMATSTLSKGMSKATRGLSSKKSGSASTKPMTKEETNEVTINHFYFKIMSYIHQKHRDHMRTNATGSQFSQEFNLVHDMGMKQIFEKNIDVAKAVLDKLRTACTEQHYTFTTWQDANSNLAAFVVRVASANVTVQATQAADTAVPTV